MNSMNLPIIHGWLLLHRSLTLAVLIGLMLVLAAALAIFLALPRSAPRTHGAARWANRREIKSFIGGIGPVLGRSQKGELLNYRGDAPLFTAAPTRSGKGAGLIIPSLLHYSGSAVVIDPKGEAARATAARRREFGPVHILDPFAIASGSAGYNPLAGLDLLSRTFTEDAATLADAICAPDAGSHPSEASAHFNESARSLVAAFIAFCAANEPKEHFHLGRVNEYLGLPREERAALLQLMAESDIRMVSQTANLQLGRDAREAESILSTAARHCSFMKESPSIVESLSTSTFSFVELKSAPATVFMVLPPDRLSTFSRWLRLLLTSAVNDLSRAPLPAAFGPVLMIIDECAALGRLAAIENAFALLPGFGIMPWAFFQDLNQARSIYGEKAASLGSGSV